MKMKLALAVATALTVSGCSSSDADKAGDAAKSAGSQVASQASGAATAAESAASSAAGAASSKASEVAKPFTMPNEVGKTLQTAQDDLQEISGNPAYVSFSDDALGKHRNQVVDSHWKVCSQKPAAGTTVEGQQEVRFQTVKTDETCP